MTVPAVADRTIAALHDDGFVWIHQLIDNRALAQLRAAYDEIISTRIHASGDRMLGGITHQVMGPSRAHPLFDQNPALDAAIALAKRAFGHCDVARTYDMLIDKPAGHPHETPWHQDLAYACMPFAPPGFRPEHETLQFWVALDDADESNGCMQFVPGYHHQPLLDHVVASGQASDEGRLLALVEPTRQLDLAHKRIAAIPAGGCTVHFSATPHYTGPNRSLRSRRAYIFNIGERS